MRAMRLGYESQESTQQALIDAGIPRILTCIMIAGLHERQLSDH